MRAEGRGERHVGPVPWKAEGREKPDVIVKSWKVCGEQTVQEACLEFICFRYEGCDSSHGLYTGRPLLGHYVKLF